jgi:hypothetical protein
MNLNNQVVSVQKLSVSAANWWTDQASRTSKIDDCQLQCFQDALAVQIHYLIATESFNKPLWMVGVSFKGIVSDSAKKADIAPQLFPQEAHMTITSNPSISVRRKPFTRSELIKIINFSRLYHEEDCQI